jgi:hypothetical protein
MIKPTNEEFEKVVTEYLDDSATWADTFDTVDSWTTYYQSKFWLAVYKVRSVSV